MGLGRASDTAPGDSTEGLEARLPLTGSDEATEVEETGDPEGDAERKRPGKESEIWVQAQLSGGTDKAGEVRQGTEESSELDRQVEAKSIPGSRASPEVGETEAVALSQTCGSLSGFVLVDRHHGNPARRFVPGHRRAASSPLLCDEWRAGVDDHVDVSRALLKRARSWSDASNSSRDQQDAAPLVSFGLSAFFGRRARSRSSCVLLHTSDSDCLVPALVSFPALFFFRRVSLVRLENDSKVTWPSRGWSAVSTACGSPCPFPACPVKVSPHSHLVVVLPGPVVRNKIWLIED